MQKPNAIYPGTFDPITLGHIDIVRRAQQVFGKVTVAITTNPQKKPIFSLKERVSLAKQSLAGIPGVEIGQFNGLLVDYAKKKNCNVLVRGLRAISDFEAEFQHALVNRKLSPSIETVFITTSGKFLHLNSTVVKEIASLHGQLDCFVPGPVEKALRKKFKQQIMAKAFKAE